MSKSLNRIFFFFFLILLLVVFYKTAAFWMSRMTYDEDASTRILNASIEVLCVLILGLIFVNNRIYLRGIHAVCLLWLLFMSIALALNNTPVRTTYFKCLFWPLLFEATYIFVKDNTNRTIQIVRLYYLIGGLGLYLFLNSMIFNFFGHQSNMVYFFVLTAPILLLKENRAWKIFVLVLVSIMAMVSMKRSMMLAIALFWFIYFVGNGLRDQKHWLRTVFLAIIVAVGVFFAFGYLDKLSGGFFSERFQMEDMSNGRNDIYESTWEMQKQSTTVQWLFGHGHNAVRDNSVREISAHNEWMEILYDYGSLVLLLYLGLWICLIKRWLFHYKTMSRYLTAYTLSLSIFAVMSLVSQLVLYVSYFLYLVMFWAIVEALTDDDDQNEEDLSDI